MPYENELHLVDSGGSIALTTDGRRLLINGTDSSYPGATILVASTTSSKKAQGAAKAVCTGTNDDLVINTALAALPNEAAGGGVVLLAEGTYTIGNTGIQMLGGNQHLRGVSKRGATYLVAPAGCTATSVITVGNSTTGNLFNNSVSRLSIDGTNMSSTATAITESSNMFLGEDLYIQNIANGINLSSQTVTEFAFHRLRNVDMYQITNDGVATDGNMLDVIFEQVVVGGVFNVTPGGRYGFNLAGGYHTLMGCRAHDFNDGWGILTTGCFMLSVIGGHFDENGKTATAGGIHCDATTRINITGAKFNSNNSYDVYLSNCSNSSVIGIQANGAGTKGPGVCSILVAGSTFVTVADCNVVDMQAYGIVTSSSNNCSVHDNMVSNPTAAAVHASIRVFAGNHNAIHHNMVANGISEESTADFNSFDRNCIVGGSMVKVGASSVVTAFP